MVKIQGEGNPKIGTFFKASNGGKIIADGVQIDGVDIDRFADADTEGHISARDAFVHGKVKEGALASRGGSVDISDATFQLISAGLAEIDARKLGSKIADKLGVEESVEDLTRIVKELQTSKTRQLAESRLRKLGLWDAVERVGGLANIVQAAIAIAGLFLK